MGSRKGDKFEKKLSHDQRLAEIAAGVEKTRMIVGLAGKLGVGVAAVLCTYFVAGSTTSVSAVFKGEINQWFLVLLLVLTNGVSAFGWRRERKLRAREVEALSGTVKTYEKVIDAKRSSTGLGPFGEPRKLSETKPVRMLPSGEPDDD